MTSRERVIAAIEFKGPDKAPFIPIYLPACLQVYPGLKDLLEKYPSDFAGDGNMNLDNPLYKKGQWTDEWGCVWTVSIEGVMGQVTGHPLEDDDALQTYVWPKAADYDLSEDIRTSKEKGDKYARVGWLTFFERMVDLRGFENVMCDIFMESEEFHEIFDHVLEYNLELLDRLVQIEEADCVAFADDWGTQLNMMIDPVKWKKLFLPAYQKMFAKVKAAGKHVFFHTDGYTMPILEDIVAAGADTLWVDMAVNPTEELVAKLGGKVCFQAITDIQFILLNSTPDEIRAYGKDLIKKFGDFNGGFIGCSEIDPDQPWENVVAIWETLNECNTYPLV